jgi:threonine aldolase
MRQAGIIAAAGIVALEEMVERLREDHDNAARLARGLATMDGLSVDIDRVQTNIVYFDVTSERFTAEAVVAGLAAGGVQMLALGPGRIRAVTHYGIDAGDIDRTLTVMAEIVQAA